MRFEPVVCDAPRAGVARGITAHPPSLLPDVRDLAAVDASNRRSAATAQATPDHEHVRIGVIDQNTLLDSISADG